MQPRPLPNDSPWLTVPEAAALMRLGKNRVYQLCASGQLPHRRVGVSVHIRRDVAESWQGNEQIPMSTLRTVGS